jgi:hypothetical protein
MEEVRQSTSRTRIHLRPGSAVVADDRAMSEVTVYDDCDLRPSADWMRDDFYRT